MARTREESSSATRTWNRWTSGGAERSASTSQPRRSTGASLRETRGGRVSVLRLFCLTSPLLPTITNTHTHAHTNPHTHTRTFSTTYRCRRMIRMFASTSFQCSGSALVAFSSSPSARAGAVPVSEERALCSTTAGAGLFAARSRGDEAGAAVPLPLSSSFFFVAVDARRAPAVAEAAPRGGRGQRRASRPAAASAPFLLMLGAPGGQLRESRVALARRQRTQAQRPYTMKTRHHVRERKAA